MRGCMLRQAAQGSTGGCNHQLVCQPACHTHASKCHLGPTCFSSSYTKLLSAAAAAAAAAPCFLPLPPLGPAPPSAAAAAAAAAESSRYTGPSMPYLGTNTIRPLARTCGRAVG